MSTLPPVPAAGATPDRQAVKRWVRDYVGFFETLTPATLDRLDALFETDARFTDPFNDARGPRAIRSVFEHMFATCRNPGFQVIETAVDGQVAYLKWYFTFDSARRHHSITGISRVVFADSGRISRHEDHWDAAGQVYERLPFVGWLLRRLRRKIAAVPESATRGG